MFGKLLHIEAWFARNTSSQKHRTLAFENLEDRIVLAHVNILADSAGSGVGDGAATGSFSGTGYKEYAIGDSLAANFMEFDLVPYEPNGPGVEPGVLVSTDVHLQGESTPPDEPASGSATLTCDGQIVADSGVDKVGDPILVNVDPRIATSGTSGFAQASYSVNGAAIGAGEFLEHIGDSIAITVDASATYVPGVTSIMDASGIVYVTLFPAPNATIDIQPYSGQYDGRAHGISGTATGAQGEDLSSLLNLGPTYTNAGNYTVDWTFAGNNEYASASGTSTVDIAKADPIISVNGYGFTNAVTYDGNAHAATGSAIGVNGESLDGLDVSGTTHTDAGNYAGDPWTFTDTTGNYNDATGTVDDSIAKADATISVVGYGVTYDGNAHTATGSAIGVNGESLGGLDVSGTTHTNAGAYTDTWTFTDTTGNYNDASGTVDDSIAKADAKISVTPYDATYDGNAHTATGTAIGVNGESLGGLDMSGTTHTNAGDYAGDPWTFTDATGNYNDDSGHVDDSIAKAPTTTTANAAAASFSTANQNVTLSASVAPGSGVGVVNEGTVTFSVFNSAGAQVGVSVSSGIVTNGIANAVFILPAGAPPGTYQIQAVYNPGADFIGSFDNTQTLTVNPVLGLTSTTTQPTKVTKTYAVSAQTLTLTGRVTSTGRPVNGGTITFRVAGFTPVTSVGQVLNGTATASFILPAGTPPQTFTITTVYSGNAVFAASANFAGSLTVTKAATAITWRSPANITYGTKLTGKQLDAAANVAGTFVYTPAAGTVLDAGNRQTLMVTFTPANTSDYSNAIASVTINVLKANTAVTLRSSARTSVYGQSVTFTAGVSAVAPGAGVPTGTVTFKDGAITLGTAVLSNGVATFSTPVLAVRTHTVTAVYGGNGNYLRAASSILTQTVNKNTAKIALVSSINPSTAGQSVTFTATLTGASPVVAAPTGTVTFKDGTTVLATVTLVGGVATFPTSKLSKGNHSITAVYSGDVDFLRITSTAWFQTVN